MDHDVFTDVVAYRLGLNKKTANDVAFRVLSYFGYGDVALDNMLTREDRQVFYMLEEVGILRMDIDHMTLYDGRDWRVCTWMFNAISMDDIVHVKEEKTIYEEIGWV